ncbi:MAG TPA: hypothetical protein VIC26_15390 [Marinagarivorans sp.]
MGIKIHGRLLPPLFCIAIGGAVTLLLATALWWWQGSQSDERWSGVYGANLASMAAKSAVDATLNHDLVSLQVVLKDVAQSPHVVFATIHDVEDNLLVQAGEAVSPHRMSDLLSFSSAIGFQQNVAGRVTVHLRYEHSDGNVLRVLVIVVALLFLIAALSLLEVRHQVFEKTTNENARADDKDSEDASGEDAVDPEDDAFIVRATAQAVLELHEYPRLMKTLSADLAASIKTQLCDVADYALANYGGQWARAPELTIDEGILVALFPSAQSEDDALRTAAFFCAVVKAAFVPACVKASVDAVVGLQDEFNEMAGRPASPFAIHFLNDEHRQALARRLNMQKLDDHWWQLDSFDVAYQRLLDKQVEQLLLD